MALELSGKSISSIIKENIKNRNTYFVFASDIVKKTWLEWVIKNPEESGVKAVNSDRFIAWDKFKTSFAISKDSSKINIPPVIRKIFVQNLIEENKQKEFFDYIISSDKKYKENSLAFTDWMAKLLPSLKLWHNQYKNFYLKSEKSEDDEENRDYEKLYKRYTQFLEDCNFYEPSYLDTDFNSKGNKFIIIYPELLEDYSEFTKIFEESNDIVLLHAPEINSDNKIKCIVYNDARKELRRLCLKIRRLQKDGVDLRSVAVNVPDLEAIRPYIEREFQRYSIPYIVRSGMPYMQNCGGDIFKKIQSVLNSSFSYNSLRALLLDGYIPWKNQELNDLLVQKGQEHRCICCYEDNGHFIDIWEKSLDENSDELVHYKNIKTALKKFSESKTFCELMESWINFRDTFIDEEMFKKISDSDSDDIKQKKSVYELTNKVLGQMITCLKEMQSIEEQYMTKSGLEVQNVLDFYISEMETKLYKPNISKYGVNIFRYRVAASGCFKYNFVINATQKDISVPFRKLNFITDDAKRKAFGLKDGDTEFSSVDASEFFVKAYSESDFCISSSKENFNGAAITHTCLEEVEIEKNDTETELDQLDFVKENFLKTEFSKKQKEAFEKWSSINKNLDSGNSSQSQLFISRMRERIGLKDEKALPIFSASLMNRFFQCPRKWCFDGLKLTEDSLDAHLLFSNELGTFYHRILELILREFKNRMGGNLPLYNPENKNWIFYNMDINVINGTTEISSEKFLSIINSKFDYAFFDDEEKRPAFFSSELAKNVVLSQKSNFISGIYSFFTNFCSEENYAGLKIQELETNRKIKFKAYIQQGFMDCLLTDADDNAYIIDFKTGSMPKNTQSRANEKNENKIENFQMAVYVNLTENGKEKNSWPVIKGTFCKLNGDQEEIINTARKKRETFENTLSVLDEYSQYFAQTISDNKFEPVSTGPKRYIFDMYRECLKCGYKSICRTSFNIAKKSISGDNK